MWATEEPKFEEYRQLHKGPTREAIIERTQLSEPILHQNELRAAIIPSLEEKWRAAGSYSVAHGSEGAAAAPLAGPHFPLAWMVEAVSTYVQLADPVKYLARDHIYSVKTRDMLAYSLDPDEAPVLPGCRMGQLFHSELYGSDARTRARALQQIRRHSKSVIVGFAHIGEGQTREVEFNSV